jgi:hypothetical protein
MVLSIALRAVSLVFGLLLLTFGYALIAEVAFDDCGLTLDAARNRVIRELRETDRDVKALVGPIENLGTCWYLFTWRSKGHQIDYAVRSTWLHGVKFSFYDHREDH